jgi:hypothetical protein
MVRMQTVPTGRRGDDVKPETQRVMVGEKGRRGATPPSSPPTRLPPLARAGSSYRRIQCRPMEAEEAPIWRRRRWRRRRGGGNPEMKRGDAAFFFPPHAPAASLLPMRAAPLSPGRWSAHGHEGGERCRRRVRGKLG